MATIGEDVIAAGLYIGLHRWLGGVLNTGPEGSKPLVDLIVKLTGMKEEEVIEIIGVFLTKFDVSLVKHAPKLTSP